MNYVITDCALPEDVRNSLGHKRFDALLRKATAAGISWDYLLQERKLEIHNAPVGLEVGLAQYGKVEVREDA